MPPEIILALTAIVVASAAGIRELIKATVNRRVKKMEEDADQALKDREATRQKERAADQQATLRLEAELEKAKADASDAKVIGENLTNLTAAFLKSVETYAKEQFANREALSNNTQTVGDLAQSVDRVGTILSENTSVTRTTGAKADNIAQAVTELFNRFVVVFPTSKPLDERFEELKQAIIEELEKKCEEVKKSTQEINVVKATPTLDELPKASGQ